MAQIAAGELRYVVRAPGGVIVTFGDPIEYDILDNSAAPLVYIPDHSHERKSYGTINDYRWEIPPGFVVVGSASHCLEVQFKDSSERTPATANFTVSINVGEYYFNALSKKIDIVDRKLLVGDRVTKDTSGTEQRTEGLKDNTKTTPYEWSPILRYFPAFGRNWRPRGRQRVVVDGV